MPATTHTPTKPKLLSLCVCPHLWWSVLLFKQILKSSACRLVLSQKHHANISSCTNEMLPIFYGAQFVVRMSFVIRCDMFHYRMFGSMKIPSSQITSIHFKIHEIKFLVEVFELLVWFLRTFLFHYNFFSNMIGFGMVILYLIRISIFFFGTIKFNVKCYRYGNGIDRKIELSSHKS